MDEIERHRPRFVFPRDGEAEIVKDKPVDFGITTSYATRLAICACIGSCEGDKYALDLGHLIVNGKE